MKETADNLKEAGRPARRRLAAVCAIVCVLGAVLVAVFLQFDSRPEAARSPDAVDVPLGVEEAVIIRYAGPRLVPRPYRRGASVNIRIADQVERDGVMVYDVRYIVNLPGEFDLTDYLTAADGTRLKGLPSFFVRGQTRLTKTIETRIQEIENVEVSIWHGYYETLAGLGVFWILWLAGLIFIGRRRRPRRSRPPPPPPSLEERIHTLLRGLPERELSVAEKADLETLLLAYWKKCVVAGDEERLAETCRRLQRGSEFASAYGTLQMWLHNPTSTVNAERVLAQCTPGKSPAEGRS